MALGPNGEPGPPGLLDFDSEEVVGAIVDFDDQSGVARIRSKLGAYPVDPPIWVSVFLLWARKNRANTVHFLRDHDDRIVRQLIHYEKDKGVMKWFEALPVPWDWANLAFDATARTLGLTELGRLVQVPYRIQGRKDFLSCALITKDDMVFYFTEYRPEIPKRSNPFPS